ncbi:hypothetical protein Tcan_08641 [Toxocara canis]|uniref:Uncharacterized protein n=1 Tax=Toxocara canis TaxID=6265 RepID=A0A0B2W260_TOXCA|nr:hypothetical protein Tcan_08641 [Toxocara canis]
MSLDKTLENVNSSLEKLTTDVSQLLDVVKVAISVLFAALVFMIVALTLLCCYIKCKKVGYQYNSILSDAEKRAARSPPPLIMDGKRLSFDSDDNGKS